MFADMEDNAFAYEVNTNDVEAFTYRPGNGEPRTVMNEDHKQNQLTQDQVNQLNAIESRYGSALELGVVLKPPTLVQAQRTGETIRVVCLPADGSNPYLVQKELIFTNDGSHLVKEPDLRPEFGLSYSFRTIQRFLDRGTDTNNEVNDAAERFMAEEPDDNDFVKVMYHAFSTRGIFSNGAKNAFVSSAFGDVYVAKMHETEWNRGIGQVAKYIDMPEGWNPNREIFTDDDIGPASDEDEDDYEDDENGIGEDSEDDLFHYEEELFSGTEEMSECSSNSE